MKDQQSYSHSLLHSIAPSSFSSLRLNEDDSKKSTFDWGANEAEHEDESLAHIVLNFLKTTAILWGIIKLH